MIILIIDSNIKPSTLRTVDINNPYFGRLTVLVKIVNDGCIKTLADKRGLVGGNNPVQQEWTITVGNPKGNSISAGLKGEEDWDSVCSHFRQLQHEKEAKTASKLTTKANCKL